MSRKALIRSIQMIATAHVVAGVLSAEFVEGKEGDDQELAAAPTAVTVLLESDVDPSVPRSWGWD